MFPILEFHLDFFFKSMELEFIKLEFLVGFFFFFLNLIPCQVLSKSKSSLGNSILGWNSSLINLSPTY